jgi:predicted ATPase
MLEYKYDERPLTKLSAHGEQVVEAIKASEYSVLVGRNNCGKSYLLKQITQQIGENASYLGPARLQNFNLLSYFTPNSRRRKERFQNFLNLFKKASQNEDNSPVNLQQAIAELSDSKRTTLAEIAKLLLGAELEIRQTVPANSMSQRYVSCNGHNLSFTSSGFRLIITLVTSLLDDDYEIFLIDEPELGISPEAQGVLADFLFDREHRKKYFPHIKCLVLATHSTIFLDRQKISNNHIVEKQGDDISIAQVKSQNDFNRVHFFLLGNRFETLYLPSAILVVEGKCDLQFIERVTTLLFPNAQTSVIQANSDDRVKEIIYLAKGLFTDIQRSPYRDRIFVVLDSVHSKGLPAELVSMGVPADNIITWPRNGIEYYYPPTIMDKIFGAGEEIQIDGDRVKRNGFDYSKAELAQKVVAQLEATTVMHGDFSSHLLAKLGKVLGGTQGSAPENLTPPA